MDSDSLEPRPPKGKLRSGRNPGGLLLLAGGLLAILLFGMQLGALPWRFRRHWLQLQGGLMGLAVGFVAGRLTASRPPR